MSNTLTNNILQQLLSSVFVLYWKNKRTELKMLVLRLIAICVIAATVQSGKFCSKLKKCQLGSFFVGPQGLKVSSCHKPYFKLILKALLNIYFKKYAEYWLIFCVINIFIVKSLHFIF